MDSVEAQPVQDLSKKIEAALRIGVVRITVCEMHDDDSQAALAFTRALRMQAVAAAREAAAARALARSLQEASASAREAAQPTLDRNADLRRVATELQQSITAYANALQTLGRPIAHAIEDVRSIAEEAMQRVPAATAIRAAEREGLVRDLVIWTVDTYAA